MIIWIENNNYDQGYWFQKDSDPEPLFVYPDGRTNTVSIYSAEKLDSIPVIRRASDVEMAKILMRLSLGVTE